MNISDYRATHKINVARTGGPRALTEKFDLTDNVKFYSSTDEQRWVAICEKKNSYTAHKVGTGVTTGNLDKDNPTLRSW